MKQVLDRLSEKAAFSIDLECHSSILNPDYKPNDTGLFFYATIPGECHHYTPKFAHCLLKSIATKHKRRADKLICVENFFDENQLHDDYRRKSVTPVKQVLDKPSEKAELSNDPECHSSILNPNYKPIDTGLFFYATIPGECYTPTKMHPPVCRIYL